MLSLIMAGGGGSRLNLGEKPLVTILGKPMISYIIDAFAAAGCTPVVAASPHTPMTINWCRAHGIEFCKTGGAGYIEDMSGAVRILGEDQPLFVCVSDIPCITPDIIRTIRRTYQESGKDACSTWIPSNLLHHCHGGMLYHQQIDGAEACPAGVNILRGDLIAEPQDELQILLSELRLAFNVNTREDLAEAEYFFRRTFCP
jgi:adenosylcobinamide-phosphate guanylyltransferase